MDAAPTGLLAEGRANRLARIALQLALARHGRASLPDVEDEAARLGLAPQEVAPALARLRERGDVMEGPAGWTPRSRPHMATRVQAREQAARHFWGWR
ncbi:MAG: hypothetical protein QOE90_355 [Thermoplasmata archaeon]|jgi:hypothetical protein|nr:hypothetical protein [Thermoplasmata archaeon]